MNFDIEQSGKAVFSSTGTFASLSAKPKHFVVTVPAISLYAQLIPGNLFLMDGDVFDETNLNRQILCTRADIGRKKAEVAEDRALSINPDCAVTAVSARLDSNTVGLLESFRPDCVIDAVDQVTAKLIIIGWALENGVHVISSMGTGNRTDAGSFRIGDISDTAGCGCPLSRVMRRELRARGIRSLDVLYAEEPPVRTGDRTPASISFVPPVAGYLIAGHAVRSFLEKKVVP